jgi:hypothetical protein
MGVYQTRNAITRRNDEAEAGRVRGQMSRELDSWIAEWLVALEAADAGGNWMAGRTSRTDRQTSRQFAAEKRVGRNGETTD